MVLILGAALFIFAWENIQTTKLGYAIEKTRHEIKEFTNANQYFSKEIQTALSPEKLQKTALKLGMIFPEPDSIVMLDEVVKPQSKNLGWLAKIFKNNSIKPL